jgi:hypothetical protein
MQGQGNSGGKAVGVNPIPKAVPPSHGLHDLADLPFFAELAEGSEFLYA